VPPVILSAAQGQRQKTKNEELKIKQPKSKQLKSKQLKTKDQRTKNKKQKTKRRSDWLGRVRASSAASRRSRSGIADGSRISRVPRVRSLV
jgi:hypothetical protein